MASTFLGLTISYTGLQAAQTAINVTSHNVSNINTPGYSKEQASTQASDAIRTYSTYGTLGTGVTVTSIDQLRDSYYDKKYRSNQANYGQYVSMYSYMGQVENYFNEFTLNGYCKEYKNFFTAVNQVSQTPGEETAKSQLINNAKSLTDYFNTLSTNLKNIQVDANNEIKDTVSQINSMGQNIAALNKQINQIEANYGNANDLRDKRNELVDELSQIVNIDTTEQDMGNNLTNFSVLINGQTLVSGYTNDTLKVVPRTDKTNASDADGLYDVTWSSGNKFDLNSTSLSGELKALVDIRDGGNGQNEIYNKDVSGNYVLDADGNKTLTTVAVAADSTTSYKGVPYYQAQLNKFIKTFTESVNSILESGYSSDGKTKGEALFVTQASGQALSASNITVSNDLLTSPNKLATKSDVSTGQANADVTEQLKNLESKKIYGDGTGAYFLESMVSDMSIDSSNSSNMNTNYTNLKNTIQNQRLSVMGVDEDEEAMDMVKFQQAYNLNSKMLSVMNQIYDKLINQTGV
jgi:flagellar hook-associated protein 1 FlgK